MWRPTAPAVIPAGVLGILGIIGLLLGGSPAGVLAGIAALGYGALLCRSLVRGEIGAGLLWSIYEIKMAKDDTPVWYAIAIAMEALGVLALGTAALFML